MKDSIEGRLAEICLNGRKITASMTSDEIEEIISSISGKRLKVYKIKLVNDDYDGLKKGVVNRQSQSVNYYAVLSSKREDKKKAIAILYEN